MSAQERIGRRTRAHPSPGGLKALPMEAPPRSKRQPVRRHPQTEAVTIPNVDPQDTTTTNPQNPAQLTTSPSQTPPPHESRSQSPQVAESRSTSPPEPPTHNTRSSRSRSPSQLPTAKGKAPQRKPAAKKGKSKAASKPRAATSGPSTHQGVGTSSVRGEKRPRSDSNDEDAEDAGDERTSKRARKETPTSGFLTPGKVRRNRASFTPEPRPAKRRNAKSSPVQNDASVAIPLSTLTNNEKIVAEHVAPSHDVDTLSTIASIETADRSRYASNPPTSSRRERSVSPEDSGDFEEYGLKSNRRRKLKEDNRTAIDLEKKKDLLAAVRLTDLTKLVQDKAMRNEDSSVEKKAIADILAKGGIIPSGFSPSRTSSTTACVVFPATATRKEFKLIDPNIIETTYKIGKILTELPESQRPSPDIAAMGFHAIASRLAYDEQHQSDPVPAPSPPQKPSLPQARHRDSKALTEQQAKALPEQQAKALPQQQSKALPEQTSEGNSARDSEDTSMSESESEVEKVAEPQTPIQAPIQTPMRAPESQGWRTIATFAKSLVSAPFSFLAGRPGAGDAATTNRPETDFTFDHPHNLPPPPTTPSRPSKQSKPRAQSERRPTSKSQLKGARGLPENQIPKTERRRRLDNKNPLHLRQDILSSRRSEFRQQQDDEKRRQREEQATQIQKEDNGHTKNTYSLPSPESSGDDEPAATAGLDNPAFAPRPAVATFTGGSVWSRLPEKFLDTDLNAPFRRAGPPPDPLAVAAVDAFARNLGFPVKPSSRVQGELHRDDGPTTQNADNPFAQSSSQYGSEDPNDDLTRARRPTGSIGRQVDSVTANIEEGRPPLAPRPPISMGGKLLATGLNNGYPSWSIRNPIYRGFEHLIPHKNGEVIGIELSEYLENKDKPQTSTERVYNPNPTNTYAVPTSPTGSDSSEDGNDENVEPTQDSGAGNTTLPPDESTSVLQQKQWSQSPPPKTPRPGNAELPQQSAADLLKAKAQQHQPKISSKLREVMVMSSPPVNVNVQMDIENWEGIFDPRVIKAVDSVAISYPRPERRTGYEEYSDQVETAVTKFFT